MIFTWVAIIVDGWSLPAKLEELQQKDHAQIVNVVPAIDGRSFILIYKR